MIGLEHLSEPGPAQRNFDLLAALVPDLGGQSVGIRFGVVTLTWPGGTQLSSSRTVTHGLATTPIVVVPHGMGSVSTSAAWPIIVTFSYTSTAFTIQAKTHDLSSPTAGTTANTGWVAIG